LIIYIHPLFTNSHLEKSPIFQSKTLTLKNKNLNFQNFLSPFQITTYGPHAPKNTRIFDSKLPIRLIIEGGIFLPVLSLSKGPHQEQGQYMKLESPITNNHSSLIDNRSKRHLYNCRESSTNPPLFMQNKPNFQGCKMM
jgi:hypothetical protein